MPAASNMGLDRTAHWIETQENRFEVSFIRSDNPSSSYENESNGGTSTPPNSCISSGIIEDQTVDHPDIPDLLQGCQDDPLIPSAEDIEKTFRRGDSQWRECLGLAERQQTLSIPGSPDILGLTDGVPPLPSQLRGLKAITGYPIWKLESEDMSSKDGTPGDFEGSGTQPSTGYFTTFVNHNEPDDDSDDDDLTWQPASPPEVDEWSADLARGNEKTFSFSIPEPTRYRLIEECNSNADASPASPSNGITILILCISYFFSAKLLEMQQRKVIFTSEALSTRHIGCSKNDKIVVDLRRASPDLVCWLCILLAPKSRWKMKSSPPWALVYDGVNPFDMLTSPTYSSPTYSSPGWATSPSSEKAAGLISELCALFRLYDQLDAAVSATVMLPFYNFRKLTPTLPIPILLQRDHPKHAHDPFIQYSTHISQLMTISISPRLIGSSLWSVFWESGVDCNVVSAWLSSIHHVIRPVLELKDMGLLIKMLMLYRPQQAPFWIGVLWLGPVDWLGMIESYLTTLEEQPEFTRASQPDSVTAAWLGCRQSFLDEVGRGCYEENGTRMLSNSDLARLRFNYRYLANAEELPYGWQPIGSTSAKEIEPELHPYLKTWRVREYHGWVWILGDEKRCHSYMIDKTEAQETPNIKGANRTMKTLPLPPIESYTSREATFRVLAWASRDACGDQINLPNHPWLID